MRRRSDGVKPLGKLQILALAAAVNRGAAEVTMLGTGEHREVADVVADHRVEIVAMARDGSAAAARLLEGFDNEGVQK